MKVISATVAAGGSGGTNGTQTVTGTTGTGTKFTASVTVASNAITAVLSITLAGSYSVMPTVLTAEPVTGASLTGAQLSIVMGVESVTVTAAGRNFNPATAVASFSGGGGSGATATASFSNTIEQRLLTLIEVVGAFMGSSTNVAEIYAARDILKNMIGRTYSIGGTFNASTLKTAVVKAGVQKYATQPRADF